VASASLVGGLLPRRVKLPVRTWHRVHQIELETSRSSAESAFGLSQASVASIAVEDYVFPESRRDLRGSDLDA